MRSVLDRREALRNRWARLLASRTREGILVTLMERTTVVLLIAGILLVLQEVDERVTPHSIPVHGVIDEAGHLLTALIVGIGVRSLRLPVPLWSMLIGGVVLDGGHVLTLLGVTSPIAGSTRDGTHSLVMIVAIAKIGFIDARRADVWLGIAIGAVTHLVRDMGTGAVPLLWPLSMAVETTSFHRSLAVIAGMAIAAIGSGSLLETHRRVHETNRDHRRNY